MGEVESWIHGLAAMGCTFIEMVFKMNPVTGKVEKKPRRSLDHYEGQTGEKGITSALAWLGKGSPIGIMPKGGLWVLDADNDEQVERVVSLLMDRGITPLMVLTKRGGHFYFCLPDDFPRDGLKNAIHALALDFIFGPRALVVAPGSNAKGRVYPPAGPWFTPPTMDPRDFLPDGGFWEKEDTRPFLVSTEVPARRTFAARGYLIHQAPVSIAGDKGGQVLRKVAAHVVGWWGMRPAQATEMMVRGPESWNARCIDKDTGKPSPWDRSVILAACEAAEGKGSPYGRIRWIEDQAHQEETRRMEGYIKILKTCLTEPKSIRVPVTEVLGVFSWLGCPDLTATKFGLALRAHGIKRVQATKRKLWSIKGLNIWRMTGSMIEAQRVRQGPKTICPLIMHRGLRLSGADGVIPLSVGESLKEHQPVPLLDLPVKTAQVEQVVSGGNTLETRAIAGNILGIVRSPGYQTSFPWAEDAPVMTLSPASAYLPKLAEMASAGLLVAMSSNCPASVRDEVIDRFWPGQKAAKVSIRVMRHACRKCCLVTKDGALTQAGLLALGMAS